jgi:hypothetical protein
MSDDALPDWLRAALFASVPLNVVGAISFAPPFTAARHMVGLPDAAPFYLWTIAAWILLFGYGYLRLGMSGRADRTFLAVAAGGKASFGALMLAGALAGQLHWLAGVGALPDLVLAAAFAAWLRRADG